MSTFKGGGVNQRARHRSNDGGIVAWLLIDAGYTLKSVGHIYGGGGVKIGVAY